MMKAAKQNSLEDIAYHLLCAAQKAGAQSADVLIAAGVSTNVEVRNGALELAERSEGIDIGLRVFIGKKQAIVSGSDGRPETITTMAIPREAVLQPSRQIRIEQTAGPI